MQKYARAVTSIYAEMMPWTAVVFETDTPFSGSRCARARKGAERARAGAGCGGQHIGSCSTAGGLGRVLLTRVVGAHGSASS